MSTLCHTIVTGERLVFRHRLGITYIRGWGAWLLLPRLKQLPKLFHKFSQLQARQRIDPRHKPLITAYKTTPETGVLDPIAVQQAQVKLCLTGW